MRVAVGFLGGIALSTALLAGCGQPAGGSGTESKLTGEIIIAGSSTVKPITQNVAVEFAKLHGGVNVVIQETGTGGGFKKFAANPPESAISNASRPISASEREAAEASGTEFIEIPVAYDALSVVVNPRNPVGELTVDQLRRIFRDGSNVNRWSDVDPSWPSEPIVIFMPGEASGTYDFFQEAILGTETIDGKKEKVRFRDDGVTKSESDNVLVKGIEGNQWAIGFFGLAYYHENEATLKAIAVKRDDATPGVLPATETVFNETYVPLSRPLFIYVNTKDAERAEVVAFVDFYLANAKTIVGATGYVPLTDAIYEAATKRWTSRTKGTMYVGETHGKGLLELMAR